MFRLILYYNDEAEYSSIEGPIIDLFEKIKNKWDLDYEIFSSSNLNKVEIQRLKSEIRSIPPQVRGKIVSSSNYILPLSGSKNLNLKNTRILLLYRDGLPINVFPHLLGMNYNSIEEFLDRILKYGPSDYVDTKGILESPIQKILSEFPSIIEDGMHFIDLNVKLENGEIDLLFQDREGNYVVIEIETFAKDVSFTQVCRLATEFSRVRDIPIKKIRKMIVCLDYLKNILKACKSAGVELYEVKLSRARETLKM